MVGAGHYQAQEHVASEAADAAEAAAAAAAAAAADTPSGASISGTTLNP